MIRRICIIGSSYIGAVYSAFKTHLPAVDRYDFDFYGHSNGGFPNVDIVGGHIRNTRFKSLGRSADIREYDAFFIYADVPSPHTLFETVRECSAMGCSHQVIQAVVSDIIAATTSAFLAAKIDALTHKPVVILSRNVALFTETRMRQSQYDYVIGTIERGVAPHGFLPFSPPLFGDRCQPRELYYRNSIKLTGDKTTDEAKHDNNHMNEEGGLLVLNAMVDHLDRLFADRGESDPATALGQLA